MLTVDYALIYIFFNLQYLFYELTVKDSILDLNLDLLVIKKILAFSLYPSIYRGFLYSYFILLY